MKWPGAASSRLSTPWHWTLLEPIAVILSHRSSKFWCFLWKGLMGNGGGLWEEGMTKLLNPRNPTRAYVYSLSQGGLHVWGWPGTEWMGGREGWVTLQALPCWEVPIVGISEPEALLRGTSSSHGPQMKGREPTTGQVGTGCVNCVLIVILSMALRTSYYYLHFSSYQGKADLKIKCRSVWLLCLCLKCQSSSLLSKHPIPSSLVSKGWECEVKKGASDT